jgi:hypothetical protein
MRAVARNTAEEYLYNGKQFRQSHAKARWIIRPGELMGELQFLEWREITLPNDDKKAQEKKREAFITSMKTRLEQAQANGESPEQIRKEFTAQVREEAGQQAPQIAAQARSWLIGFRNFLIVGALAFGLAIGLALLTERLYTTPLCEKYAASHGLAYRGLDYPVIGSSSSTTSSGSCIFVNSAGHSNTIEFRDLAPNAIIALAASFALQIEITIPVLFVVIALIAVAIGRLRKKFLSEI